MAKKVNQIVYDPPGVKVALVSEYKHFVDWCAKWGVDYRSIRPLLTLSAARGLQEGLIVLVFDKWWEVGDRRQREMDSLGLLIENKAEVWRDINKLDPVVEKGLIVGWRNKE